MSYESYRGRTLGRVLYFLNKYLPSHISDHVKIGWNEVEYGGETIAIFKWSTIPLFKDVPIFSFKDEELQSLQNVKINKAISEISFFTDENQWEKVSFDLLKVISPEIANSKWSFQFWLNSNEKAEFLFAKKEKILFVKFGEEIIFYSPDIKDFLYHSLKKENIEKFILLESSLLGEIIK